MALLGSSGAWCAWSRSITEKGRLQGAECVNAAHASVDRTPYARSKKRVYLLDVHAMCYRGDRPDPLEFVTWAQDLLPIVMDDPVVAVLDGANGNDFRRQRLPSYKAQRKKYHPLMAKYKWTKGYNVPDLDAALLAIHRFLHLCHIPVVKVDDAEADDTVATLTDQSLQKNMKVVIASPDKDFKQLLCENVQLLIPLPDLRRWSFYTLKDYIFHHKCEPSIELGLRCLLGDAADGVPGLSDVSSGWGRKTALKLMRKYGCLEALLDAAAVRTVGKPYVQAALQDHASLLLNNLAVLKLRRDVNILMQDEWFMARDTSNDRLALQNLQLELQTPVPPTYSRQTE